MTRKLEPLSASGLVVAQKGKRLVGPVDLSLASKGLTVFIGPNGSGKTTLLKTLHGLQKPRSGTMSWADVPPLDQAFVFQSPAMLRRSVAENLAFPLQLRKRPRTEVGCQVKEWAARIDLSHALTQPAARLSGGEKQKLALARALITGPRILFADEPCTNLDGRATRTIETLISEARDAGTRILLATHDLGQVRRLATDIVFLNKGHVLEAGPASELLETPKTKELAAYLKGDIVE